MGNIYCSSAHKKTPLYNLWGAILLNVEHLIFSKELKQNKLTGLDPTAFDGLLAKAPKAIDAFNKLSTNAQVIVKNGFYDATKTSFLIANSFAAFLVVISIIWVFVRIKEKKWDIIIFLPYQ